MIKYILSCMILALNINSINGGFISSSLKMNTNKNILNTNINKKLLNINKIKMSYDICPEYLTKFTNLFDKEQSEMIVKGTTSFLTKVDGVGGYILHTNDVIINFLLNNEVLNNDIKKSLILQLISLSQAGDATGHQILQFYYDLVSCLL